MTDDGLATAAVDAQGVVVAWSAQARSLLGWLSAEVVGRPAADLLAADLPCEARKTAERLEPWDGGVAVRHRDGRRLDIRLRAYPVDGAGGRSQWLLAAVGRDVTEKRMARRRLELVNEAATRIGSTLDVTRTADEFVEVAVPRLADHVFIDLLDSVLAGDEPTPGPIAGTAPLRRVAHGSVLRNNPEAVIQPGQVTSYAEHSATANCLATGRTALYQNTEGAAARWAAQDPALAAVTRQYGFHSVMVVPVRVRGATLGIATFVRHRRPDPFEEDDLFLAEQITALAAICIDNARRYMREHDTAIALQRSLLPERLHRHPAVDVASRYVPAGTHSAVGGDWYDVIKLSGARVGLVVGDVVGHGMYSAASMCRLRTAVRTLADGDPEPDEMLTSLDDVVTRHIAEESVLPGGDTTNEFSATCLYAVYDAVSRRCSLARAGHPLPIVVSPEGRADLLDLPAGPPLGFDGLPFEATEVELPEGSLLVFYTDGLIESRERDIEAGLNELRRVLTEVHQSAGGSSDTPPSLETVCDAVLETLVPGPTTDDVALLIARTHALDADRVVSWELPAEPVVVADFRARACRLLGAWGLEDLTFTTELVVSELVTNAIRYARGPIQLRMILAGALICEVSDRSSTAPHLRRAHGLDETGRGLQLVDQLTELWGTRQTRSGKTIWAELTLPTG
jgi:PAS domain S-box-containing protein